MSSTDQRPTNPPEPQSAAHPSAPLQAPPSQVPGQAQLQPQTQTHPAAPIQSAQNQQQHQAPIEVDTDLQSEGDSAYGDEISTYSASLTSSVVNYQYENGRRYHAFREGSYVFPNDEQENDRLDIHSHMVNITLDGRMHLAPIGPNPQRILDLGTGTGIWAIEMGDLYPSAEIIGNDLSPIQPGMVPPNVRFIVDDMEDEWTYDSPFDYIHCRYLAVAIANWPQLLRRTFQHLTPGGWAEFQDWDITYYCDDGSLKADSALVQWDRLCIDAAFKNGRHPNPGPELTTWMADAGFTNIHHEIFKLPLGPWAKEKKLKEVGMWNLLQIQQGMEAFTLAPLTRIMGWKVDEVQVLLANARKEMKDPKIHAYYNFHVAYGQRPGLKADHQPLTEGLGQLDHPPQESTTTTAAATATAATQTPTPAATAAGAAPLAS
ncbi:MAG: hypothetical protein M1826_005378 [Phylliscum demangeonii]|nr:MAG: hypothetical protein M1826_005378 [Phylliscum demangeonii]